MIAKLLDAIDALSDWSGRIFCFTIPLMMLVTAYEVVMRYAFKAPTVWALETTQYLFLSSTALGGAYVLLHRHHVNVSILYDRLSAKSKALVDVVTAVFFFAFVLVLLRYSLDITIESVMNLQHSPSFWAPPIYPVYVIMTLGVILVFLQGLAMFLRNVLTLWRGAFSADHSDKSKETQ
jgi:TRAP-type mannitol/chloroaromatic compound transport system permease small subunit